MKSKLEELDPGIRRVVALLWEHHFETTDSGDGKSKLDMDCAMDVPNIAIRIRGPKFLAARADNLINILRAEGVEVTPVGYGPVNIQASYDPADNSAVILLIGLNDAILSAAEKKHE